MPHLSHSISGTVRLFSHRMAGGMFGHPLLDGLDYSCIFEEPTAFETAYAIFINVLEIDGNGLVLNAEHAEHRAAEWIHGYLTGWSRPADPPFEDWEVELH
jgi:hypothetical protein